MEAHIGREERIGGKKGKKEKERGRTGCECIEEGRREARRERWKYRKGWINRGKKRKRGGMKEEKERGRGAGKDLRRMHRRKGRTNKGEME